MNPIFIVFIVLVITLVGIFAWKKSFAKKGSDVLFMGLSDAGKTVLFSKLVKASSKPFTQTSIKPNSAAYKVEEKGDLQLIDIPGNERLRLTELEKYKSSTRGVVFVVNSETVSKEIRDVAELIYQVLTDPIVNSNRPKVLIAANKQDATIAKSGVKVKQLIEQELTIVRKTQTAALKDTEEESKSSIFLGKQGTSTFEFSQLIFDVEVQECSGKQDNLDAVRSWLFSCA